MNMSVRYFLDLGLRNSLYRSAIGKYVVMDRLCSSGSLIRQINYTKPRKTGIQWRCVSNDSSNMKAHDLIVTNDDVIRSNKEYKGILQIKENKFGRGLFADRNFVEGDKIMSSIAKSISIERDSHSVQTGLQKHVTMNIPAILINHSCSANVGIHDNDEGAFDFYALCVIKKGEELLWDYETAEYEIESFSCSCGAIGCRRELKGFSKHGEIVKKLYGDKYIARYLLE